MTHAKNEQNYRGTPMAKPREPGASMRNPLEFHHLCYNSGHSGVWAGSHDDPRQKDRE
jgi:hypothetical protein